MAALHAVETRSLVRAVKRNVVRFTGDFMFQLTPEEVANLRSQTGISSSSHGGRRYRPYAFTEHGVTMLAAVPFEALCAAVGVSRSAHYEWSNGTPSKRQLANERLLAEIRAIHAEHEARYGSPRMRDELRDRGHRAGKHRVARLMRDNAIRARMRRRFKHTTDSNRLHSERFSPRRTHSPSAD